ncbi:MAG: DUF4834 family protein [Cellulophaga sp.]|uniref:DUF4834 family protein n=1 Tax=unclassified Cellulophaga TaxID=2634405 RepID=UPI000C2C17F9|nr:MULTISPECIES: DUF4834 family protein [unclassified Cellulophaga]MDO6491571.1 DUF4834 family protein [Cellulophaga sp. 2_MG-2023]MDO6493448.1 DUF4834 family protein [Cellulophaga sp. 3_MG-2023]PKB44563.1 uncharacterized protein DUF4834 [Cellulophaga sp. RHA19]
MDFLIAILVIITVYYLLKFLVRLYAPKMMNYAAKKTEEHLKKKFEQFSQNPNQGNPNTTQSSASKKKTKFKSNPSKKVGEYIDFEEVE